MPIIVLLVAAFVFTKALNGLAIRQFRRSPVPEAKNPSLILSGG